MTDDSLLPFDLPAVCRKKMTAAFDGGRLVLGRWILLLRWIGHAPDLRVFQASLHLREHGEMVQSIDNLTIMIGTILSLASHPTLSGYGMVTLRLEEAQPVEGKADLISNQVGNPMPVAVRRDLLSGAKPGMRLRCRAKRTPDGAMCEKHPEDGQFAILPPT